MTHANIENHMVLDRPVNRIPQTTPAELAELAYESAAQMSVWQLMDCIDDLDLILSTMPAQARDAYYTAHRKLVAAAIVENPAIAGVRV